ncbi:MAG: hypothetical protein ACLFV7_14090, partial [Phycisphaerae bacterium]
KQRQEVAKLVEKLGNEDRAQREQATADLMAMPKTILPLLREHFRQSRDAEVRARIEMVVEHHGEKIKDSAVRPTPARSVSGGYSEIGFNNRH